MEQHSKKTMWKVLYGLLIVLCILCVVGIMLYLKKDEEEQELIVEQQEEIQTQYVQEEAEIEKAELPIDFESLQSINQEVYAWIEVPGTNINYPILQHEGDQSYYLTRDMYGEEMIAGSIYTEVYNSRDFTDPNTIIYGHNMKNGSMFHNVRYFTEKEYFDEHRELYIYMPEKILKYEIIACYEYDDRHLLAAFNFHDEAVYAKYLEEIMNPRSIYAMVREDFELTTEDRLVTLSTCIANKPNNRRLLQAVLVEEIEAQYKGAMNEATDET